MFVKRKEDLREVECRGTGQREVIRLGEEGRSKRLGGRIPIKTNSSVVQIQKICPLTQLQFICLLQGSVQEKRGVLNVD